MEPWMQEKCWFWLRALSDNIIVGYNAASSSGGKSGKEALTRNVVIGSEQVHPITMVQALVDCVYVGYRAGMDDWFNTGLRNTMIGASAGATSRAQNGTDHTIVGYDAQNVKIKFISLY